MLPSEALTPLDLLNTVHWTDDIWIRESFSETPGLLETLQQIEDRAVESRTGTSRVTFYMDDNTCIKVAYNDRGVLQNKTEVEAAAYAADYPDYLERPFGEVFDLGQAPTAATTELRLPVATDSMTVIRQERLQVLPITDIEEELPGVRPDDQAFWAYRWDSFDDEPQLGIHRPSGRLLAYDY